MLNVVQPNIPPTQPESQTPTPVSPPTKKSRILLLILLGLVIVAVSIIVGIQIGKKQIPNQQLTTVHPTISSTQTIVNPTAFLTITSSVTNQSVPPIINTPNDPTADWKTYKNSALGFELKYPSSVQIEEVNGPYNNTTMFKGENLNFEVMLRKKENTSLDNYYFMDTPITRKTTLADSSANVYEMPNGYCDGPSCSLPYIAIVTEKGSDFYHISFFGDVQLSEVEQQILSTFKFTN